MSAGITCAPGRSELTALRRENEQLRQALDSRTAIDQATGALMLRYGLDGAGALALLRRWSQTSNRKLRTIADTLVAVVGPDGRCVPPDPGLARWLEQQVMPAPHETDQGAVPA